MLWIGLACSAVYLSIALYADAKAVYQKLRDLKFYLREANFPTFSSVRSEVRRYRSSLSETITNFATIPIVTYPLRQVYKPAEESIQQDVLHLLVAATASGILFKCWDQVYPRRKTKYTIETGNLLWFTGLMSGIQFPWFFFQIRESMLWSYMVGLSIFLAVKNIPDKDQDEKRLPSLLAKRARTTLLKSASTRPGGV